VRRPHLARLPNAQNVGFADMDIERNIQEVERRIASAAKRADRSPHEITIVAVTKGVEPRDIRIAVEAGIMHVGENRVQDAKTKTEYMFPAGLRPTWHMVGHLQTNKVKTAVEIFDIIHSIDSVRLAESISKRVQNLFPVLLQVNVSGEESKSGFSITELPKATEEIASLPNLEVKGLMTIAPFVRDPEEVRPIFRRLRQLRDSLGLEHLSMGMTDDFEIAMEEGATLVRIGRAIFKE
jgi:pyridoxal phosphate enzyme (YggS family)